MAPAGGLVGAVVGTVVRVGDGVGVVGRTDADGEAGAEVGGVVAGADGTVDVEVDPAGTRLDQRRRFARVPLRSPATLVLPGGVVACRGVDLSGGGLRVALPAPGMTMSAGDTAVAVLVLEGVARLPVRVRCVGADDTVVRLAFESVTPRAERRLCRHVFELEREQRARAARVA